MDWQCLSRMSANVEECTSKTLAPIYISERGERSFGENQISHLGHGLLP